MRTTNSGRPDVSPEIMGQTPEEPSKTDELRELVVQKQQQIDHFLDSNIPRKARLLNVSIIGGIAAAALTAGPAIGGKSFDSWLSSTVGLTIPFWQLLCGAAALCSATAAVATLLRSQNLEEQVNRAQRCKAKLEMIDVGLATNQLETAQAASEFMKFIEEAALLPECLMQTSD